MLIIAYIILGSFILAWAAVSVSLLVLFRVFRAEPLRTAPQRHGQLTLSLVVGVLILYFGLGITAFVLFDFLHARTATSATLPATVAATTTAPTSAPNNLAAQLAVDSVVKLIIVGIIVLLATRLVVDGLRGFGLSLRQFVMGLLLGALGWWLIMPLVALTAILSQLVANCFRQGPSPVHPILEALGEHPSPLTAGLLIASPIILAPLAEETFFRGLIQTALLRLGRQWDYVTSVSSPGVLLTEPGVSPLWRWVSICTASLLFASVHLTGQGNYEVLPPLFVLAVGMGYLYERTGNLWASITVHAIFNAVNTAWFLLTHS